MTDAQSESERTCNEAGYRTTDVEINAALEAAEMASATLDELLEMIDVDRTPGPHSFRDVSNELEGLLEEHFDNAMLAELGDLESEPEEDEPAETCGSCGGKRHRPEETEPEPTRKRAKLGVIELDEIDLTLSAPEIDLTLSVPEPSQRSDRERDYPWKDVLAPYEDEPLVHKTRATCRCCGDRVATVALMPCAHVTLCVTCCRELSSRILCSVCGRSPVAVLRVYM